MFLQGTGLEDTRFIVSVSDGLMASKERIILASVVYAGGVSQLRHD